MCTSYQTISGAAIIYCRCSAVRGTSILAVWVCTVPTVEYTRYCKCQWYLPCSHLLISILKGRVRNSVGTEYDWRRPPVVVRGCRRHHQSDGFLSRIKLRTVLLSNEPLI